MVRFLKYSDTSYKSLQQNPKHTFAQNHSLNIYRSNSIYSFIPKNACSTMRTSIAYANGCIQSPENFNWIHKNNQTFKATLADLVRAEYTFVILRCPYRRLASVYLDKIVGKYPPAWGFYDLIERKTELDDFSFAKFVDCLTNKTILNGDLHWKPQIDFLVYQKYDDYFCVEDFDTAVNTLKAKIDVKVIDARKLTNHGLDKLKLIKDKDYSKVQAKDIFQLKQDGLCPDPQSLYSETIIKQVQKIYRQDIALYLEIFGKELLMFN